MFDRIAEEKILSAIENGEFENLPGFGKPIEWKPENPYQDEWAITYEILQKHDFSLPWIEKRKEIETAFREATENCECNLAIDENLAYRQFFKEIEAVNRKIFDYNLCVPVTRLQRRQIDAEELFSRIKKHQR